MEWPSTELACNFHHGVATCSCRKFLRLVLHSNFLAFSCILQAALTWSLWSGYHWKGLFFLQKLSIDDNNFGQKWWCGTLSAREWQSFSPNSPASSGNNQWPPRSTRPLSGARCYGWHWCALWQCFVIPWRRWSTDIHLLWASISCLECCYSSPLSMYLSHCWRDHQRWCCSSKSADYSGSGEVGDSHMMEGCVIH